MSQKSKEFQQLETTWYNKLKKSGFEDIENKNEGLKTWSNQFFRVKRYDENYQEREEFIKAKTLYYQLAGTFLHEHKFDNKVDKTIWMHHANGASTREISKLFSESVNSMEKSKVDRVIQRLKKIMLGRVSNEQS